MIRSRVRRDRGWRANGPFIKKFLAKELFLSSRFVFGYTAATAAECTRRE